MKQWESWVLVEPKEPWEPWVLVEPKEPWKPWELLETKEPWELVEPTMEILATTGIQGTYTTQLRTQGTKEPWEPKEPWELVK